MTSYLFENYYELSRLPYFKMENERLVIDKSACIGPIIDIHTHLALAYILPMRIDLFEDHGRTEYMLPEYASLNLETYANKDYTPELLKRMRKIVARQIFFKKGAHQTHNVAHLTHEMSDLGIEYAVILPVDLPLISNNAKKYAKAAKKEQKLIPFGCVHPFRLSMKRKLERQIKKGIKGVKFHPNAQAMKPNHRLALKLYKLCGERDLPVLWHCGPVGIASEKSDYRCQLEWYGPAVEENPDTTFILGHSGALQMEEALEISKKYPNTYLDLACQSLPAIQKIIDEADPSRILFGTDWPWYHEGLTLAKVLIATEGKDEIRRKILYENAKKLLNL